MNKVINIIDEHFDSRCLGAVISYLMENGTEYCKNLKDEDINKIQGESHISKEFIQGLVKAASEIAKQCDLFDDVIPFIITETQNHNGISWHRMNEIAGKAIDGLLEDDEEQAREYLREWVELDEDEAEWFGIKDLYED